MGNRCQSCEKFVSLEFDESNIEINDLEVSDEWDGENVTVHVTGNVRIVRTCADCGDELKEATLDIDSEVPLTVDIKPHRAKPPKGENHCQWKKGCGDLTVEDDGASGSEEGGHRYKAAYFGASTTITVTCGCGEIIASLDWSDRVSAGGMDDV